MLSWEHYLITPMAQSLLTNDQMAFVDTLYDTVFATFKRQIEIITEGTTTIVQSNPAGNFNPSYKLQNTKSTTQQIKTVIDAIVEYSPTVTDQVLQQVPELKALQARGLVRLSVEAAGRELLKKNTDVQFDGHSYEVETDDIPRTMFGNAYYWDFWLVRKN